jgi:hypothetical protein
MGYPSTTTDNEGQAASMALTTATATNKTKRSQHEANIRLRSNKPRRTHVSFQEVGGEQEGVTARRSVGKVEAKEGNLKIATTGHMSSLVSPAARATSQSTPQIAKIK